MIVQMYSVYDRAVKAFGRPFYAQARGQAVRDFMDAVQTADSPFFKHPEDFTLFFIGAFDDADASMTGVEPEKCITALECVKAE